MLNIERGLYRSRNKVRKRQCQACLSAENLRVGINLKAAAVGFLSNVIGDKKIADLNDQCSFVNCLFRVQTQRVRILIVFCLGVGT